ncbi:MAG: Cell division protein FtsZ [Candidatus Wolfebacteria bacterium GW2011_GWC2_46_275]|uniref:Cell division protein FtsZ n=2 Tax=Candidatus Wolfeibacteriota TaxID=1752735 RepID=A0A0G1U5L8_9BACT|nr:MAG: cell division protein FtsZ, cell division protein FtsZ [Candidatus Wolfebacteria bacterium GW2011_GWB1_47_1]KKU36640.1 MAG: Cell division protein FtsZ [Candidatus Wolfebacteria bacterium GW2011_GWC2_46_275]KKU41462.1 MAG: Cell division protein FtsZ [Candidatus Wolfebacteria bacterium GW2011_GWB2_46_69]KKU53598.1 MAG: Cell division protein FtsZ [Candidatus Wolfebacteria bacterium GW2011_GWC1_47_103]KKU58830.1 MAG: Cell division protein FtsZ [Candidatus Wolfebacteria bacterium GW2011_GWE2
MDNNCFRLTPYVANHARSAMKAKKTTKAKTATVPAKGVVVKRPAAAKKEKNKGISQPKTKEDNVIVRIKVVGVGGGGSNAIDRMYEDFPRGVDLIAINTDLQDLQQTNARKRIYIGKNLTKGMGTGMNPDLGKQAAEESRNEIMEAIKDADMIFVTAGMGGGTGTGAAPVVAEIAKDLGILTVGIVTKPFAFEGAQRARIAEEGIIRMRDRVDTLITIPNDRVFSVISKETTVAKTFEEVDKILRDSVRGVTELILTPGIINIDFADVKAIIRDSGSAMVGLGVASGNGRAGKAASSAINSPLLETSVEGAKGILLCISGRNDLKMHEINEIASAVAESADPSAKIIFGTYYDRKLNKGQLRITLIATGFTDTLAREGRYQPYFAGSEDLPMRSSSSLPFGGLVDSSVREEREPIRQVPEEFNEDEEEEVVEEKEREWDIPAFLRRKKK